MKFLPSALTACCLFCPAAGQALDCEAIDLSIASPWIWQSIEGDGYYETYIYTFKEDGALLLEESLPGGKFKKDSATYRLDGKNLWIRFAGGFFQGKEIGMPCAYFNGQLQLTIDGNTYVFNPKDN
jgi:hypothetical protein